MEPTQQQRQHSSSKQLISWGKTNSNLRAHNRVCSAPNAAAFQHKLKLAKKKNHQNKKNHKNLTAKLGPAQLNHFKPRWFLNSSIKNQPNHLESGCFPPPPPFIFMPRTRLYSSSRLAAVAFSFLFFCANRRRSSSATFFSAGAFPSKTNIGLTP